MTLQARIESEVDVPPVREHTFRASELRRVGIATTMMVVCGTVIILATIASIGHYNPLVHCTPVSIVHGAAIALLLGQLGRWRCVALLGAVYGLVLLMQVGLVYLFPITALSGAIAAIAGRAIESGGSSRRVRTVAVCFAAALFVLICGFGTPIKIYFGTGGGKEPFVWALWFAEWPLRIGGAVGGAILARRWLARRGDMRAAPITAEPSRSTQFRTRAIPRRPSRRGLAGAAIRIVACLVACTIPLVIEDVLILAGISAVFVAYALWTGLRKQILHVALGLIWGWLLFGALSYAWHRDLDRVIDLSRTFVLRFAPMMLASIALVVTVRPVDLLRLLRRLRLTRAALIPLSSVIRAIPRMRAAMKSGLAELRSRGEWHGIFSVVRRPRAVVRALLIPQVSVWANELARETDR